MMEKLLQGNKWKERPCASSPIKHSFVTIGEAIWYSTQPIIYGTAKTNEYYTTYSTRSITYGTAKMNEYCTRTNKIITSVDYPPNMSHTTNWVICKHQNYIYIIDSEMENIILFDPFSKQFASTTKKITSFKTFVDCGSSSHCISYKDNIYIFYRNKYLVLHENINNNDIDITAINYPESDRNVYVTKYKDRIIKLSIITDPNDRWRRLSTLRFVEWENNALSFKQKRITYLHNYSSYSCVLFQNYIIAFGGYIPQKPRKSTGGHINSGSHRIRVLNLKADVGLRWIELQNIQCPDVSYRAIHAVLINDEVHLFVCNFCETLHYSIPIASILEELNITVNINNHENTSKRQRETETELKDDTPPNKKRRIDEFEAMKRKIEQLQKENLKLKIERDEYKLKATALRDISLHGANPRKQLYESDKLPNFIGIECTKSVKQLYDKLRSNVVVSKHHETISLKLKRSINEFIELNSSNYSNNLNYENPQIQLEGNTYVLDDLLEKKQIKKGSGYRVKALEGSFGCFSKEDIPDNTILGRYLGYMAMSKEWNEMFDFTNVDEKHSEYLFEIDLDENLNKYNESRHITIDPICGGMIQLKLLYINDCRANIFDTEPTDEDKELQNVKFIVVKEYGLPTVMVVTIKDIKKGTELLLDYGKRFGNVLKQNERWKRMMQMQNNGIVNNIIGNTKLDDKYDNLLL